MQPRAKRSLASHLSGYKPKRRKGEASATAGREQGGVQGGVGVSSVCQVQVGPSCRRLLDGESPQLSGDGKGWGCPCPEAIPVS